MAKKQSLEDIIGELDIYSLHVLIAAIDTIREHIGDEYKNTAVIHNLAHKEVKRRREIRD